MQKFSKIKYYSLICCLFLVCIEITSSVPIYSDYENSDVAENIRGQEYQIRNRSTDVRDLYELLLKKEALEDQLNQSHQIVRKSNRSPSLRLRFGKKRDPYLANPHGMGHPIHLLEDVYN